MSLVKTNKAVTMADLMKSVTTNFVSPHKGDLLEGRVNKLSSSEILIDIGAKSLAVVLEKDKKILRSLLGSLKVGDKVSVSVLNPESDFGNTVVSLRRFNDERVWEKLEVLQKSKEKIEVTIDEVTKGGFLVSTRNGISGFLPNSQVSFLDTAVAVGKNLNVCVIELSRPLKKVIFSQKATVKAQDFAKQVAHIKRGELIKSTISNIAPFGIFTLLDSKDGQKIEGFVHISEVAWEKLENIPQSFKPGDEFEAQVLGADKDAKRINLSIKRLTTNPYEEKLKEFTIDKKVSGTITRVSSNGITVDLGAGIEGIIKKEKIPPTVTYSQGSLVEATVLEVDRNQRVVLAPVLKEKPIGYR